MPKKKTPARRKSVPVERAKPTPAVEPTISEFMWRGNTRYKCSKCMFDSSTMDEAERHYQQNHVIPEPKVETTQIDTGLVSPDGGKIIRVEEVQDGEN